MCTIFASRWRAIFGISTPWLTILRIRSGMGPTGRCRWKLFLTGDVGSWLRARGMGITHRRAAGRLRGSNVRFGLFAEKDECRTPYRIHWPANLKHNIVTKCGLEWHPKNWFITQMFGLKASFTG